MSTFDTTELHTVLNVTFHSTAHHHSSST